VRVGFVAELPGTSGTAGTVGTFGSVGRAVKRNWGDLSRTFGGVGRPAPSARPSLRPSWLPRAPSAFRIPHSAFRIPHSAFRIPHSAFRIPHSAFIPFPPPPRGSVGDYNRGMSPTPATRRPSLSPAVCLGCTLCCDDVGVSCSPGKLTFSENTCTRGRAWFQRQADAFHERGQGACRIGGREAGLESALEAAAELLRLARNPLVCGLSHLSVQEQQAAVRLAVQLRGQIDLGWEENRDGNLRALQQTGRMTATLGQVELQSSAFLIVEAAPELTHPRMFERLGWSRQRGWRIRSADLPAGKLSQVSVGAVTEIVCSNLSELNELIWLLRCKVMGKLELPAGIPGQWRQLVEEIVSTARAARGLTLVGGSRLDGAPELSLGVHLLTRELNEICKAWLLLANEQENAGGAESVLTWSSGFPRAVSLKTGEPNWNREEYSAANLIRNGDVDCLIACVPASDSTASDAVFIDLRQPLRSIPRIVFHCGGHPLVEDARVSIPVGQVGWDVSGEILRMDELTLTAPRLAEPARLGLANLFEQLEKQLG
jgi:formylmethanofuran dehydrogenase subunit B